MDDVLIRRCRLNIRRRGGWHWGRDPRRLLEQATRMLPLLIANQLRHYIGTRQGSLRIPSLRIRVPATLDELEGATMLQAVHGMQPAQTPLEQRIRRQVEQAIRVLGVERTDDDRRPTAGSARRDQQPDPAVFVEQLLTQFRGGFLFKVLRSWPVPALEGWERMLRLAVADARGPERALSPESTALLLAMLERQFDFRSPLPNSSRTRVALMTALLARYEAGIALRSIDAFVERYLGTAPPEASSRSQPLRAADRAARMPVPPPVHRSETVFAGQREVAVSTVLPFVLTGVLSRSGVLETLTAALNAVEASDDMDCFAAAVAFKVGTRPLRGWRRDEATKTAAAAMSGSGKVPANARIASFLRRFDSTVGVLASTNAARRAAVQTRDIRLLLDRRPVRGVDTWMLIDIADGRPVAWATSESACLDMLACCGNVRLLVNEPACRAALLDELDRRQTPWITNLRPDTARRCDRPSPALQLWTNRPGAFEPLSVTSAAFGRRVTDAALVQDAFLTDRPLLLPADNFRIYDAELELSALVAAACGDIAAKLWDDEDYVEPLMTLERLGDLDGSVRFEDERVFVTPALGKRYMDLYRNDFFTDVAGVPWLDGRVLQFGGL
jgi:hypothetical protein